MNTSSIYMTWLVMLSSIIVKAQNSSCLMGSRGAGMGYASATVDDEWSIFNNTGGLYNITLPTVSFAVDHVPNLPGANRIAAVFAFPSTHGAVGIGFFKFGDPLYHENLISLAYSNKLGISSLGGKINYVEYYTEAFGVKRTVSISVGGITQLTPQLAIGTYINNLAQTNLSQSENVPTQLIVGVGYQPTQKVRLAFEIEKDLEYEPIYKGGIEYAPVNRFSFRTGYNLHPTRIFFGFGFSLRNITFDYSINHSTWIGIAQNATIRYQLKSP